MSVELSELGVEERVLLAGLVRLVVDADDQRSGAEMEEFRAIAEEMGRRAFDSAFREALSEIPTVAAALAFAHQIERPEARDIILTIAHDLAAADGIAQEEADILVALRELWGAG